MSLFNRAQLVGTWYRNDTNEQGALVTEFAEMSVDGSYAFTFSEHDLEGLLINQSIEIGDWGLVGDIHFTMAKSEIIDGEEYSVDFSNENNYHAYKITQLTEQIFEYHHVITNEVFIMRRVIDKIGHC